MSKTKKMPAAKADTLNVLNTGSGHNTITFDGTSKEQVEKANATITDMLKRGYMIFVDDGTGGHKKVKSFNPKIDCYIIQATPTEEESVPRKQTKATAIAPTTT